MPACRRTPDSHAAQCFPGPDRRVGRSRTHPPAAADAVAPAPPRRRWSVLDYVLAAVVLGFAFLARLRAGAQQRPVAAPGDRPRPARRQVPFRRRSVRAGHRTTSTGSTPTGSTTCSPTSCSRAPAGSDGLGGAALVLFKAAAGDGPGGGADPAGVVRPRPVGAGRRRGLGRAGAQPVADAAPDDRLVPVPGSDALFPGAPAPTGRRPTGAARGRSPSGRTGRCCRCSSCGSTSIPGSCSGR